MIVKPKVHVDGKACGEFDHPLVEIKDGWLRIADGDRMLYVSSHGTVVEIEERDNDRGL